MKCNRWIHKKRPNVTGDIHRRRRDEQLSAEGAHQQRNDGREGGGGAVQTAKQG